MPEIVIASRLPQMTAVYCVFRGYDKWELKTAYVAAVGDELVAVERCEHGFNTTRFDRTLWHPTVEDAVAAAERQVNARVAADLAAVRKCVA